MKHNRSIAPCYPTFVNAEFVCDVLEEAIFVQQFVGYAGLRGKSWGIVVVKYSWAIDLDIDLPTLAGGAADLYAIWAATQETTSGFAAILPFLRTFKEARLLSATHWNDCKVSYACSV